jgi:hypothetical protein
LKEQDVLRTEIELMATKLQQTEPSVDDLEDSCTTAQIMSMCAAPHGWMDIEEALFEWLQVSFTLIHVGSRRFVTDLVLSCGNSLFVTRLVIHGPAHVNAPEISDRGG